MTRPIDSTIAGTPGAEASPQRPSATNHLKDVLDRSREIIGPFKQLLPEWHERITELLGTSICPRLRIVVVGVTSTGKSSLINVLLGEAILPDQATATTNVPVVCRYGPRRMIRVELEDGTVRSYHDTDVTPAIVKSLCAEDENPNNSKLIKLIEIELPTCIVSPQFELVDTPGTNAYGLPQHEAITIQRCIPMADIVVFLTTLDHAGLNMADMELLQNVIESNQRVIFVGAKCDIVASNSEHGQVLPHRAREMKLRNKIDAIADSLRPYPKLHLAPIFAISSLWARRARGDTTSALWKDSNMGSLIDAFTELEPDFNNTLSKVRIQNVRNRLRSLAEAIPTKRDALYRDSLVSPEETSCASRAAALRKIESSLKGKITQLKNAAHADFNPADIVSKAFANSSCHSETSRLRSVRQQAQQAWDVLTRTHQGHLTKLRGECRDALSQLGLTPGRHILQDKPPSMSLPSAEDHISEYTRSREVPAPRRGIVGWFLNLFLDEPTRTETETVTSVDISGFRHALKESFSVACDTFRTFIDEQAGIFCSLYVMPIQKERQECEKDLQGKLAVRNLAAEQIAKIPGIVHQLQALLSQLPSDDLPPAQEAVRSYAASRPDSDPPARLVANAAIRRLLHVAWTAAAATSFWRVIARAARGREVRRILWVGTSRERLSDLLSILDHANPQGGSVLLSRASTGSKSILELWMAFSAEPDSNQNLDRRCDEADLILVDFNAAQPSSGLSTLRNDPRHSLLMKHAGKVVVVSLDGASFEHQPSDLAQQVVPLVQRQAGLGSAPWFVVNVPRCDARYTDFIEIHRRVAAAAGAARVMTRYWREAKLSTFQPFTLDFLESQFIANTAQEQLHE